MNDSQDVKDGASRTTLLLSAILDIQKRDDTIERLTKIYIHEMHDDIKYNTTTTTTKSNKNCFF